MVGDLGEHLFEVYAAARGYEVLGRDVDLGTTKRPDFLIRAQGYEIVVEVKTFDAPTVAPMSRPSGFVTRDLKPMRERISAGARQLRGIPARPLVVVLNSPLDPFVPMQPTDLMQAMYGDLTLRFGNDGLEGFFGRNAKLRVDQPEGPTRGDHPHLGAVAVLRHGPVAERRIIAWLNDRVRGYPNDLAAFTAALHHVEQQADQDAGSGKDVCYLDMFEALSDSAVPVPRSVFAGPLDGRWGRTAPGRYGPLTRTSTVGAAPVTS